MLVHSGDDRFLIEIAIQSLIIQECVLESLDKELVLLAEKHLDCFVDGLLQSLGDGTHKMIDIPVLIERSFCLEDLLNEFVDIRHI